MRLSRTLSYNPAYFTIVPLLNVLLLPLVFFSLSTTFTLQPGISIALPSSTYSLGPQQNPEIVSIVSGPVSAIYHRDQKVTFEQLQRELRRAPARDRSLIIKADRTIPYDAVVQVINEGLRQGYAVVLATTDRSE